jgi:hypothetical protein
VIFSRTIDRSATWSPPQAVPARRALIDPRLTVLHDDTLVLPAIFEAFHRDVVAVRSRIDRREPGDADDPTSAGPHELAALARALGGWGACIIAFSVGVANRR